MSRFAAFLLLVCSAVGFAQVPQIKSGATVYIEPMDGYETYLAAALVKKHVPLIVVADKDKADYIIRSTVTHRMPSQPGVVINTTTNVNSTGFPGAGGFPRAGHGSGHTSASISVIDAHSSQLVFAYSVGKANANQMQSTAEACAKHLKEVIEKQKK